MVSFGVQGDNKLVLNQVVQRFVKRVVRIAYLERFIKYIMYFSIFKLLNKTEVRRPWGLNTGEDPSIGYGEVALPVANDPGGYLSENNCAGPGAFILNSPWEPSCSDGVCYARKAIDPSKLCDPDDAPKNGTKCNTMIDCIAKVNEQNCWKPNTGACQRNTTGIDPGRGYALSGMDPQDCRGTITEASCDATASGERTCNFIHG